MLAMLAGSCWGISVRRGVHTLTEMHAPSARICYCHSEARYSICTYTGTSGQAHAGKTPTATAISSSSSTPCVSPSARTHTSWANVVIAQGAQGMRRQNISGHCLVFVRCRFMGSYGADSARCSPRFDLCRPVGLIIRSCTST